MISKAQKTQAALFAVGHMMHNLHMVADGLDRISRTDDSVASILERHNEAVDELQRRLFAMLEDVADYCNTTDIGQEADVELLTPIWDAIHQEPEASDD